jgi:hypothetical protein
MPRCGPFYTDYGYSFDHCFHESKFLASYNPPQREEMCCHCGTTRMVNAVRTVSEPAHGPYLHKKETT